MSKENMMIDRLGETIREGNVVMLLKTPVKSEHEFIEGVVVKLTDKTVHIHVVDEDYVWSGGVDKKIYKRYPHQLFVVAQRG